MTRQLGALRALAEDPSFVSSTHIVVHSHLQFLEI